MPRRSKLESVQRIYRRQERLQSEALVRHRQELVERAEQLRALDDLVCQYRQDALQQKRWSSEQAAGFNRFYHHVSQSLALQREQFTRVEQATELSAQRWRQAHVDRKGIDRLLSDRAAAHRLREKRRQRRASNRPNSDPQAEL